MTLGKILELSKSVSSSAKWEWPVIYTFALRIRDKVCGVPHT